jgi:hypothetical protein
MNTWKRKALALAAVGLLSVPSAMGVQAALEPSRGAIASWLAAGGFEAVYISTALLILTGELRVYAQRVALFAVATAVMLNVVASYAAMVQDGLASGNQFLASFDWLALTLAVVESLPLAALAYAMATLLHRLSEGETQARENAQQSSIDAQRFLHDANATSIAQLEQTVADLGAKINATQSSIYALSEQENEPQYQCPICNTPLASKGKVAAATRWGYCEHCKPGNGNGNGSNGNGHHEDEDIQDMQVVLAFEGEDKQ